MLDTSNKTSISMITVDSHCINLSSANQFLAWYPSAICRAIEWGRYEFLLLNPKLPFNTVVRRPFLHTACLWNIVYLVWAKGSDVKEEIWFCWWRVAVFSRWLHRKPKITVLDKTFKFEALALWGESPNESIFYWSSVGLSSSPFRCGFNMLKKLLWLYSSL